jgi:hypothetical protein
MSGMHSRVAAWWDDLSEQDQQRVRAARDTPLPNNLAGSLEEAGIVPAFAK